LEAVSIWNNEVPFDDEKSTYKDVSASNLIPPFPFFISIILPSKSIKVP
jgi:hypothetical protein